MKLTVKVEGLRETEEALRELPKRLAKAALKRVLKMAAQPIISAAAANAPRDTGELAGSIISATSFDNNVGKAAYASVMKSGGSRKEAAAALRAARRASGDNSILTFAYLWVGPSAATTAKDAIKRIVQEFGSSKQQPQPYMRPAWDGQKEAALAIIKRELAAEIERTAARYRAKAERLASKGK